jgi:hypothetical protein
MIFLFSEQLWYSGKGSDTGLAESELLTGVGWKLCGLYFLIMTLYFDLCMTFTLTFDDLEWFSI